MTTCFCTGRCRKPPYTCSGLPEDIERMAKGRYILVPTAEEENDSHSLVGIDAAGNWLWEPYKGKA